jgi:hypothetical protein
MTDWKNLPAGPELRYLIAQRLGWHMRKIWVGSNGIEYDYMIYNNDDHLVYQREITAADLEDEPAAEWATWLAAMDDEDMPLWDEDPDETIDLTYGLDYAVRAENGLFIAWVQSEAHTGTAETEALAIVRAWLAATEETED